LLQVDYGDLVGPERANELWRAFVSGQWLLLAHDFCDGHRRMLTCYESSKADTELLTARERRAAFLVARGQSFKEVAYELGVAVSTAWSLVGSAVRKLGLRSRVELVQIFGIGRARAGDAPLIAPPPAGSRLDVEQAPGLPCPPGLSVRTFEIEGRQYALFLLPLRRLEPPSCLTQAEREIVKGVLSERSNAEIARTRQTSKNTVANQLRAVYTKLGISGRSQLIAFC
jgi:DNA-binding CsgD family transcriptional regulator